jgi:hypothetical protein
MVALIATREQEGGGPGRVHAEERERELVGGPRLSARDGERERADRWVRAARGPGFKWIKK